MLFWYLEHVEIADFKTEHWWAGNEQIVKMSGWWVFCVEWVGKAFVGWSFCRRNVLGVDYYEVNTALANSKIYIWEDHDYYKQVYTGQREGSQQDKEDITN